jgi:hypothetical protein
VTSTKAQASQVFQKFINSYHNPQHVAIKTRLKREQKKAEVDEKKKQLVSKWQKNNVSKETTEEREIRLENGRQNAKRLYEKMRIREFFSL